MKLSNSATVIFFFSFALFGCAPATPPSEMPPDFAITYGAGCERTPPARTVSAKLAASECYVNVAEFGRGGGRGLSKGFRADRDELEAIYELAREADFFQLDEKYMGDVGGAGLESITVTAAGKTKTVTFAGEEAPPALHALADALLSLVAKEVPGWNKSFPPA